MADDVWEFRRVHPPLTFVGKWREVQEAAFVDVSDTTVEVQFRRRPKAWLDGREYRKELKHMGTVRFTVRHVDQDGNAYGLYAGPTVSGPQAFPPEKLAEWELQP